MILAKGIYLADAEPQKQQKPEKCPERFQDAKQPEIVLVKGIYLADAEPQ